MSGVVYILKDEEGRFYVGSTDNLERRLNQHRLGHTQTTRNMKGPKLVFSQEYDNLEQARKIEKRIKKLKRKDYIVKIIDDGYIRIN
ncbi:MAG: GIY-YIG nuclease family protein [Patescibacteria group bacterium]